MIKAAGYYRVSSDEQAEKDLSIPAQQKAVQNAVAKDNEIRLVAEFKDEGISAYSSADKRPGFCDMIVRAKRKEFDVIMVHKLDRFSRNRDESVLFKSLLKKHGIMVKSVTETHDPTTPQGFLYEGMIEVINQFYSMNLATETLKGMRENAVQGFRNGGTIPYGYVLKTVKEIGDNKKSVLALGDMAKIEVVRRIFDCYSNKDMGIKSITSMLNTEKIPGPRGGLWQNGAVYSIIKNKAYMGDTVWYQRKKTATGSRTACDEKEWIVKENTHPPIIEKELFDKCDRLRKSRSFSNNQRGENTRRAAAYLLSGLIKCGECGNNYTGKRHIRKRGNEKIDWYAYVCSGYLKHGKSVCRHFTIDQKFLESRVIAYIKENICSPGRMEQIEKLAKVELNRQKTAYKKSEKSYQKRLGQIDMQINNLIMAIANGTDPKLVNPKIEELKQEKASMVSEDEKLKNSRYYQETLKLTMKRLLSLAGNMEETFDSLPFEEKRHIVEQFVERIDVENHEKLVINFKIPFEVNDNNGGGDGMYKKIVHPETSFPSALWDSLAPRDEPSYEPFSVLDSTFLLLLFQKNRA